MEIERMLSDLIHIESVNPPGGETGVARYLKGLFDSHGIRNEIIESQPGRGSFLAEIGEGDKRLLYLSHTDVVPVSGSWDLPPFSGRVKDGYVHGRGALDCKGLVAAEACAMISLARSGKLGGKLIFLATADEEAGGAMGIKYLLEHDKSKLTADFAINEGGEEPFRIGNQVCHFVQVGEKGICWMKLKAHGTAAHGSLPLLGDNAVAKMAIAVAGLAKYRPKVRLIPEVRQLFREIARRRGWGEPITVTNVDRTIATVEDKVFAAYLSATTRMTVSTNSICGGTKTNIIPDSCEADVDIRVLPGEDKEYVVNQLKRLVDDVEIEIAQYHAPTFSPSKSGYFRLIAGTLKSYIGDVPVLPSISSGGTDSRFLREAGIPCYGISMMTLDTDQALSRSVHGINEKIDVASLKLKSDFLIGLARKYLGS